MFSEMTTNRRGRGVKMAKVIDLREIRRKKIIAQYIAFYGTKYDYERKKVVKTP
jgi:hypothetical protein